MIKTWLLKNELKALNSALHKIEAINAANQFFIEQGIKTSQYQINNHKHFNQMPFTLMGHGLQTAADHLKVKDSQWERARKHEARTFLNTFRRTKDEQ